MLRRGLRLSGTSGLGSHRPCCQECIRFLAVTMSKQYCLIRALRNAVIALFLAVAFDAIKHFIFPNISLWQSHISAIVLWPAVVFLLTSVEFSREGRPQQFSETGEQLHDSGERRPTREAIVESDRRYRSLFENMLEGFAYCEMLFDNGGRPIDFVYLDVNSAFGKLTGLQNVVGRRFTEIIPGGKDSQPELFERYSRVALTGGSERFETEIKALGRWFSISAYGAGIGRFVATFDNITERKQADEALLFRTALLEAQAETTIDGILVVDDSDRIILANKQFGIDFGISPDLLSAGDDLIVLQLVSDQVEDRDAFLESVKYLNSHRDEKSTDELRFKNGKIFDRYSAPLVDAKGRYRGRIWYFRDITERKVAEDRVQFLAFYDALTGLPNRTLFRDRMTTALADARRHNYKIALLFLDLDRFKDINDSLGDRKSTRLNSGH